MGRPIKARYFLRGGAKDPSQTSNAEGWYGLTAAVGTAGSWYAQGSTVVISNGQLAGSSVTATALLTISTSTGAITGITVTNTGSGYNSTSSIVGTIVQPATVTSTVNFGASATNTFTVGSVAGISIGMLISGGSTGFNGHVQAISGNTIYSTVANNGTFTNTNNLTFSSTGTGAVFTFGLTTPLDKGNLAVLAFLSTGTSAVPSEIIKQEASHRYLVENAQGRGVVRLSTGTGTTHVLESGGMHMIATDWSGATYYVTKLTGRRATLINRTNTSTSLVPLSFDGKLTTGSTGWTTGAATVTIVTIATY